MQNFFLLRCVGTSQRLAHELKVAEDNLRKELKGAINV
jgi:hypothetical protein